MVNTAQFFDFIFSTARSNAIMIMDEQGIVIQVNEAFTTAYGYTTEDLESRHFRILYTEKDQVTRRPEIEVNQVHREGAATDENYLVHKDGTPIWVTGESIMVKSEDATYIVKVIHNIHAQKQLERYLLSSEELLESLFESVQQTGLILLNTQMKTIRSNTAFRKIFGLDAELPEESKLQEINHPLWQKEELKNEVRNALVNGIPLDKEFISDSGNRNFVRFHITSKLIIADGTNERKLLLIVKDA